MRGRVHPAVYLLSVRSLGQVHPDNKLTGHQDTFIRYKRANDALADPVKRFAYDRFGPSILEWKGCSTIRDYVVTGLYGLIPGYGISVNTFCHISLISLLQS
jgi:hypothetical protein